MKHVNIKECEVCKTPFDALRSTKKTCSDACRKALQRLSYCDKNSKSDEKYQIGINRENDTSQPIEKPGFYVTVKPKFRNAPPRIDGSFVGKLTFERVNDVTYKLTDGAKTRNYGSPGQWAGYDTTRALAWLMNIGFTVNTPSWVACCGEERSGPTGLVEAKNTALNMVRRQAPFAAEPLKPLRGEWLNEATARIVDTPEASEIVDLVGGSMNSRFGRYKPELLRAVIALEVDVPLTGAA